MFRNKSKSNIALYTTESGISLTKIIKNAGYDIRACIDDKVTIPPGEWRTIETGIAMNLDPDVKALICSKSGPANHKGLTVLNSPGIIDMNYRGTIKVILFNHNKKPHTIKRFDEIAQILLLSDNPGQIHLIRSKYVSLIPEHTKDRDTRGLGNESNPLTPKLNRIRQKQIKNAIRETTLPNGDYNMVIFKKATRELYYKNIIDYNELINRFDDYDSYWYQSLGDPYTINDPHKDDFETNYDKFLNLELDKQKLILSLLNIKDAFELKKLNSEYNYLSPFDEDS